jgi:hypothetical protein
MPAYASTAIFDETVVVEEKIVTWQEVFDDLPEELKRIAKCESGLNIDIENQTSSASGLLQFIDGTFEMVWKEVYQSPVDWSKKNDPFIQMELGLWLYENSGSSHWQYPCGTLI